MKRIFILSMGLCIGLASCVNNSDLSSNANNINDTDLDLSFSFKTRTNCLVNISTINATGEKTGNILFSVYAQNPYIESNGDIIRNTSITPIYSGYTGTNGTFSKEIAIANHVNTLYIVPEYVGFGSMQEVSLDKAANGVELKGKQINLTESRSLCNNDNIERSATKLGTSTIFFHYFNTDELNLADGSLNISNGLVSFEPLSNSFIEEINKFFPEAEANYTGNEANTDIYVTSENGAEVWVTYIGDGGFTNGSNFNVCSGMYFYTYTDDNKPSKVYGANYLNSSEYHLTAIFPNVNPAATAAGTKVQLLYWDDAKNKYVSTFPKGSYIGFVLNFYGYNPGLNTSKKGFSLSTNYDNPYCSTKEFNKDGKVHAVTHWDEKFQTYIIGMERAGLDNDYNDLIAKITINEKQELIGKVDPPIVPEVSYSQSGILAFEDNWPYKGDYDFNDFITEYTYTFTKKEVSNFITRVSLKFTPKTSGGSKINGFGIQLPIEISDVAELPQNVTIESDVTPLTMILFENVQEGFNGAPSGFINTVSGSDVYTSSPVEISFELENPINESDLTFDKFNPFIFSDNRNHEIHLVDYKPTSKMDMKSFGTAFDYSDPSNGIYYRMDNQFPWALDISDLSWKWAYECLTDGIVKAYPNYTNWYKNYKAGDDMTWTKEVNDDYLW